MGCGEGDEVMFIGEIGINHNGNIELAKKIIDMAKRAGVDVVKFQKRNPDLCVPKEQKNKIKDTPWGRMTYIEYKHKIEFGKDEYDEIDRYCKDNQILWTASVWDVDSLDFILQYDVPFIKIPSACITDLELLTRVKGANKPVIISTGMSTEQEIEKAVNILDNVDLTIMHCNSSYPANDNELDLRVICTLKKKFLWHKIGYSSHDLGIGACIVAKVLGAEVIEKHITLDKTMWGSDQKISLEFDELSELIQYLKRIPVWLGDNVIKVYDSEKKIRNKLRRVRNEVK